MIGAKSTVEPSKQPDSRKKAPLQKPDAIKAAGAKNNLKDDLIKIMTPIFGAEVEKMIIDNYDSKNPAELVELAHHMLAGYMGEENAGRILDKLTKQIPRAKAA